MDWSLSIIKQARHIVYQNKQLNPKLFNLQNTMHEDIRQTLLKQAKFVIKKCFQHPKNLEIKDICLVGSSASYLYNKNSDLDMRIITDYSKCAEIKQDAVAQFIIDSFIGNSFHMKNLFFQVAGYKVDIKSGQDNDYVFGNYSILNNQWNILPQPDFDISKIKIGEIVTGYYKTMNQIYEGLSKLDFQNGILNEEKIFGINKIKRDLFMADNLVRQDMKKGINDYLIFKMIRKTEIFRELAKMQAITFNDKLSLE